MIANMIVILVLAVLVGWAVSYIVKEKKKGTRCIGCPSAGCCSKKVAGSCSCTDEHNGR